MSIENEDRVIATTTPLPARSCRKLLSRALRREGFRIVSEGRVVLANAGVSRTSYTVLVVWNPFFAHQSLLMGPEVGLLLPFCLVLEEDPGDAGCKVLAPNYRRLIHTAAAIGARVLARVLDHQIRQVLYQLHVNDPCQGAIVAGGGEYRGIQPGSAEKGIPDLVLFDDPATHTTLALPIREAPITAAAVRRKIARSRMRFARQRGTDLSDANPDRAFQPKVLCTSEMKTQLRGEIA